MNREASCSVDVLSDQRFASSTEPASHHAKGLPQEDDEDITLPVSLSQEQKALLKRVANDCPVKRNLDSSMTIDLIWSDASPTAN